MSIFEALSEQKRHAVLNAAFACFGKNGYKKTSTADIAAAAHISKASVFQYFGSKEKLFSYLFAFSCDEIMREPPEGTDDFFECIQIGIAAKLRVMERYPGMNAFLSSLVAEDSWQAALKIDPGVGERIDKWVSALYSKVNWHRLRPGLAPEDARSMARWIIDGYVRQWVYQKDADTMVRELERYLGVLKRAIYMEEYL